MAAGITINSSATPATWIGDGTSRIQNDTAAASTITANSGATLNAGIILSNGGTNPNFTLTGSGNIRLSNTGNTANFTANGTNVFSNDLSTDVGSRAFGTLGTGSFTLTNRSFLNYDGVSGTSTFKPLTIANGSIAMINPRANLTLTGVISNSDPTAFVEALGPVYANLGGTGTLMLTANNTYGGPTYVSFEAVLAIPTIGNAGGEPLGTSSNAPSNLNLGQATPVGGRGDLLLTGTAAAYSTDRALPSMGSMASARGAAQSVCRTPAPR